MDSDAFLPSGGIDDSSSHFKAVPSKPNGGAHLHLHNHLLPLSSGPDHVHNADPDSDSSSFLDCRLLRRLVQQNDFIREAWEAERTYLETNRRRAEEVYQEERIIMDEERAAWEEERAALLDQIKQLKAALERAKNPPIDPSILPPGLDGASRRPHFARSRNALSPRSPDQPRAIHAIDPRVQPQYSRSKDFLPHATDENSSHTSVIDVGQLDPGLEGISLRAPAVQKPTFCPSSPPALAATVEQDIPPLADKPPVQMSAAHALQQGELKRLTMHAGHTPSHSLSKVAPESAGTDAADDAELDTTEVKIGKHTGEDVQVADQIRDSKHADPENDPYSEYELEEQLEAMDDPGLKGPLMIKNIPAQDEIFLDRLNEKLENIAHGNNNPLPTALRPSLEDYGFESPPIPGSESNEGSVIGDDALHIVDAVVEAPAPAPELKVHGQTAGEIERDVPLKLRGTTNFGAPFGAA